MCVFRLAVMSPTAGSSPYSHPQWLSRGWCINEGRETVAAGLRLTVGLTADETVKVRGLIRDRKQRVPFLKAMTTADIDRAKVFANKDVLSAVVAAAPEGAKSIVSCSYSCHSSSRSSSSSSGSGSGSGGSSSSSGGGGGGSSSSSSSPFARQLAEPARDGFF
jgi:uncharacterized membrane protein YgcG